MKPVINPNTAQITYYSVSNRYGLQWIGKRLLPRRDLALTQQRLLYPCWQ